MSSDDTRLTLSVTIRLSDDRQRKALMSAVTALLLSLEGDGYVEGFDFHWDAQEAAHE